MWNHNVCCRLQPPYNDQVSSWGPPKGPRPNLMWRVVCTFSCIASVWAFCQSLAPTPHTTEMALFYGFSPLSCKAGGRRLFRISHALCRKLPRGRPNSLLWRPSPSLNSPIPLSTPITKSYHPHLHVSLNYFFFTTHTYLVMTVNASEWGK